MLREKSFLSIGLAIVFAATMQASTLAPAVAQQSDADSREFPKLFAKGSYDEAIVIGERLVEQIGDGKPADDFKLLVQLAAMYRATGEFGRAANTYRRAIALGEQKFGPNDVGVGSAIERFACLERRLNHADEAKKLHTQALQIIAPLPEGFRPGPVTGKVVNGTRIALPQPPYPKMAHRLEVEGTVSVSIIIDETGKPIAACTKEGAELLALNAEAAAFQARFTPTTINGVPVRVSGTLIYNFKK